jgi:hypothetical protein
MRKFLLFLWLMVYTCVSTGFAVSTHFCMNKKASVQLGTAKKEICSKCGMHKQESNNCCRDEVTVVKLQQDTEMAKTVLPSFALALPAVSLTQYLVSPFYNFIEAPVCTAFQPPPLSEALYLSNRVFRI